MPQPPDRQGGEATRISRAPGPARATAGPGSSGKPSLDTGSVHDRLERLLETPHLARVVSHLAPETLQQLIRYRGLTASADLLAALSAGQLASVLDVDLWRASRPASDERFDLERFGEWVEALVEAGDDLAARIVAAMDRRLVIAGLSGYLRVLDPAACAPPWSSDDDAADGGEPSFSGVTCEIGGYLIRARRTNAWDAVVALLVALEADHRDCFHAVMRGCRRLSNSTPEPDGLDNLLVDADQLLHDVGLDRERRRSEQGYLTAADARAFLQLARQPHNAAQDPSPPANPIAADCLRPCEDDRAASASRGQPPQESATVSSRSPRDSESGGAVADLLAEAGLFVPERPRALLPPSGSDAPEFARIRVLMAHVRDADESAYLARSRELAFLANALIAGCSVRSGPFTIRDASDAALATCNLGLEHLLAPLEGEPEPPSTADGAAVPDTFLIDHDLVTVFQAGWATLYRLSMFAAASLIAILDDLRCSDADIQEGLAALRRELVRQRDAGAPWRALDALDVIATLDTPAWVALLGLMDQCPVLPAAVTAIVERQTRPISATAFEFISTNGQIDQVRAFVAKLPDLLVG